MRNCCAFGLIGVLVFISGCAPHYANNDEQVDLYLSTLDDKHFVWCKLDLEQCRRDFEKWKLTPRGRMIIREYEKEDTGQTYNRHHLPNVFRTRFVDESQLAEEVGKQNTEQGVGQNSDTFGKRFPASDQNGEFMLEEIRVSQKIYGPKVYPHDGTRTEGHASH